jgi:hypothetical protein
VGDTVTYEAQPGRSLKVKVVSIEA